MNKDIWAICLDDELKTHPDYWVIANDYDSKEEALAQTSLPQREAFRVQRNEYCGEKLQSLKYDVEDEATPLDGTVYKLTPKEEAQ